MKRRADGPAMTIALPVRNGAGTVAGVIESVLAQTRADLELVISDNASTDATQEICRAYASADPRVVYQRHPSNVGLLTNFASAAARASGTYVRWIGDDDLLEPGYVGSVLDVFAEDERRVLVSTQIVYRDDRGVETLDSTYQPAAMASPDPVERFSELLRVATSGFARLDPLYGAMRRELATLPRKNMCREDQVFAARLALAGPWGHVAAPLAHRCRQDGPASAVAELLGVPAWQSHVRVVLQCRALSRCVAAAGLDRGQRARARAAIVVFYARDKQHTARRAAARIGRLAGTPPRELVGGAR